MIRLDQKLVCLHIFCLCLQLSICTHDKSFTGSSITAYKIWLDFLIIAKVDYCFVHPNFIVINLAHRPQNVFWRKVFYYCLCMSRRHKYNETEQCIFFWLCLWTLYSNDGSFFILLCWINHAFSIFIFVFIALQAVYTTWCSLKRLLYWRLDLLLCHILSVPLSQVNGAVFILFQFLYVSSGPPGEV